MTDKAQADIADAQLEQILVHLFFTMDVSTDFFSCDAIERRSGNVDKIVLDKRWHVAIKKCEKQRTDMRAVDVGVGHDNDLVIAQFFEVEIVNSNSTAKGRNHRADLLVLQDLFQPRFFYVQNFTADRQDRLEPAVAARLSRASRRVSLNDVYFTEGRVFLLTVGQLAGQPGAVQRSF